MQAVPRSAPPNVGNGTGLHFCLLLRVHTGDSEARAAVSQRRSESRCEPRLRLDRDCRCHVVEFARTHEPRVGSRVRSIRTDHSGDLSMGLCYRSGEAGSLDLFTVTAGSTPSACGSRSNASPGRDPELDSRAGVACVVVGAWTLGTVRPEVVGETPVEGNRERSGGSQRASWRPTIRPGIVWPFLAAMSYAVSDILVKYELGESPEPFFAATIALGTAWLAWGLLATTVPQVRRSLRFGVGIRWFVLSGCLAGVANLSLYSALDKGDVSLVAPTVGSQPLMVFILSALLLRGIERIDRSTVLGGLMIVAGTTLVSI